jgi:hypothetical protein
MLTSFVFRFRDSFPKLFKGLLKDAELIGGILISAQMVTEEEGVCKLTT